VGSESLKYSNPYHLLADDIVWLREWGGLPKLPDISSSELHDKSKGEVVIKSPRNLSNFLVSSAHYDPRIQRPRDIPTRNRRHSFLRLQHHHPKAQNVQTPIVLINYDTEIPIEGLYGLYNRHLRGYLRGLFYPGEDIVNKVAVMGSPIPNDAMKSSQFPIWVLHFGVAIGGVIFGSIHAAAWDFDFPTTVDRDIWRVASIASTYSALFCNEFVTSLKSRLFLKSWDIIFGSLYLLVRVMLWRRSFEQCFICHLVLMWRLGYRVYLMSIKHNSRKFYHDLEDVISDR
jgi:hypothetical protein